MRYCEFCGQPVTTVGNKNTCSVCGRTSYLNPRATVAIVLYKKSTKELLLSTRAYEPEIGKYDCLGGFVDVGENFEEAGYREIKEEANLDKTDLGELSYVGSVYNDYAWEGGSVPVTSVYFMLEIINDSSMKPSDDVASLRYFTADELPDEADCGWPGMRDLLVKAGHLLESM